ncbi:MAG: hypothetical protein H7A00_10375 [Hahellaceae bacterium]|nr:hypothetical protein [Hahellaceae bacterium]
MRWVEIINTLLKMLFLLQVVGFCLTPGFDWLPNLLFTAIPLGLWQAVRLLSGSWLQGWLR